MNSCLVMVLVTSCLVAPAMSGNPDEKHKVSYNTKSVMQEPAEECRRQNPCANKTQKWREVCAINKKAGAPNIWATFPSMSCLNRTICDDSDWSFCHKGSCRKILARCDMLP